MSTMWLVDSKSYVARIPFDVRDRTASQIDSAKLFAGFSVDHAEVIGRHPVHGMFVKSQELKGKLAIAKRLWFKALKLNSHAGKLLQLTPPHLSPRQDVTNHCSERRRG